MEKIITKCIAEEFRFQEGVLDFSCLKIEIFIKKEEIYKGSIQVGNPAQEETEVFVYSSDCRLQCDTEHFVDKEKTVFFQFDSAGMEEGEVLKGGISFISDNGEYYIPFVVNITHQVISSSIGSIKNLFHFANLAKSNWLEAVQVFYSKDFYNILTGNEIKYISTYRGMCNEPGNQKNLDEFLIEINKKQSIEYFVTETKIEMENPEGIVNQRLHITKNGWGYTYLQIVCEGDFIIMRKEELTDDEFLGNNCEQECLIDSAKLHAGNNYGKIQLLYANKKIEIPVLVICSLNRKEARQSCFEKQKILELTEYYIDFRTKKMHTNSWLTKSMEIVEELVEKNDKNCAARLFQAQLLITKERYNEAKWILDRVETLLKKNDGRKEELYCYYLYLTTLYHREEAYINSVTEEIEERYKKSKRNWRIAWLLLYLKEEYSKNSLKRWKLLEELYQEGCTSPIIYLEAVHLINLEPAILTKLTGFELQILFFATQRGLLHEAVLGQIHYLMGYVKEFEKKLFQVLASCYEVYNESETLQAICAYLIKGNRTEEAYFEWYRMGVEAQLRITRLYEYYMMSIPKTYGKELSKPVMMYFAYNNNLVYERKAFLYANLLRHEEKFPEMVRSYQNQIEQFVAEQLKAEHLNNDLAYLYQETVKPEMLTEEIANGFANMLFYHEIIVENPKIKQIVLVHDKVKGEVRYPLINGKAMVSIYSGDYQLLLQDAQGNRYTRTIPYTIEKMLIPRKFVKMLQPFVKDKLGFDLFVCENLGNYQSISEENVDNFERIIHSERIYSDCKKELRTKLVQYHYDNDEIREMDEFLDKIQPEGIRREERDSLIKFMVSRGMFEKAFLWIKQFGVETVDAKTVFRLASRLLSREEWPEDETMLSMSQYAFKHAKYDEFILDYLGKWLKGMTRDLRDIWKAGRDFEADIYVLSERMLVQILFSQAYIGECAEIFRYYQKYGTRNDIKDAFLTFCAFEYFVKERMIDTEIFDVMAEKYQKAEKINKVSMLALLKYFSEKIGKMQESEIAMVKEMLDLLINEQIYFPFFLQFSNISPKIREFLDRTIIEYRTKPNSRVTIHYVCQKDTNEEAVYRKQEMTNMYAGIFVKSFVLFFGENLQYYITEENNGQEQLTESATISKSDISRMEKENRFTLLNDVVLSKTLQDYETLDKLMAEYINKNYMVKELFDLL